MNPSGRVPRQHGCFLVVVGILSIHLAWHTPAQTATTTGGGAADPGRKSESWQRRLEWNRRTLSDSYNQIGRRNAKWDEPARRALEAFARARAGGSRQAGDPALATQVRTNCELAVAAGCDDPMVAYLHARTVLVARGLAPSQLAEAQSAAARSLEASQYPPIRKFYGALRAAEHLKTAAGPDTPPEVHPFRRLAVTNLVRVLEDHSTPVGEVDDACMDMLTALENNKPQYEWCYHEIEERLFRNWAEKSVVWLIKGSVHIDFAWQARGSGYADSVTEQGWKQFGEHLEVAERALSKAWELDPTDARIPLKMMTVEQGQGRGRERFDLWFHRAMALNPNNYDACRRKLYYLEPIWHGSEADLLAFGWECVESKLWGGRVPLILLDAHEALQRNLDQSDQAAYWKRAEVWPDIRASFDHFFELNPNATGWYHNYARYAYLCERWDKLNELIPKLGTVNYSFFGGEAEYRKMLAAAQAHVRDTQGS